MIKNLNGGDVQQKAFEEIKEYMKCPPVLVPPQQGKPFKLYVLDLEDLSLQESNDG